MQTSDFGRFKSIMTGLAELYQRQLSPDLLDIYWNAMSDWDIADFNRTASALAKQNTFMPRPADFNSVKIAASSDSATEAWLAALTCIKSGDYHRGVTPGGLIDKAVIAVGGYRTIGFADYDQFQFLHKRFLDAFDALCRAEKSKQTLSLPKPTPTALESPVFATIKIK